ncbi:hypothetical protein [Nocardia sp. NPDC060259]|uniref:hypothetical protein n=1 Tax=Nocardia sp. NPDC060259 TaxID=3347088 RepID=UPI003662295F
MASISNSGSSSIPLPQTREADPDRQMQSADVAQHLRGRHPPGQPQQGRKVADQHCAQPDDQRCQVDEHREAMQFRTHIQAARHPDRGREKPARRQRCERHRTATPARRRCFPDVD